MDSGHCFHVGVNRNSALPVDRSYQYMNITVRIVLSVIAVLGAGYSAGYMLYGVLEKDAEEVSTYASLGLSLFIAFFLGVNYEWFLVKTLRLPPEIVQLCDEVDPRILDGWLSDDDSYALSYDHAEDGTVEIRMLLWNYVKSRRNFDKWIQEFIYNYTWLAGPGIAHIDFKKPYTDLTVGVYVNSVNDETIYGTCILLADCGKLYRYIFQNEENPIVTVNVYNEMTGETMLEEEI